MLRRCADPDPTVWGFMVICLPFDASMRERPSTSAAFSWAILSSELSSWALRMLDEFPVQDIDDILRNRTEKRQLGNSKGNTFSTATFTVEEEPQVPSSCPPYVTILRTQHIARDWQMSLAGALSSLFPWLLKLSRPSGWCRSPMLRMPGATGEPSCLMLWPLMMLRYAAPNFDRSVEPNATVVHWA